ncbi:MAG: hypothetical protein M5U08_12680 [Burkholderiales bacterium]|nr:hypothetical protein [Burkholderiales bacterium]
MRKSDDPNFVGLDLVDDAVRKAPEEKTARGSSPNGAEVREVAQNAQSALELGDKRQPKLSIGFPCVEESSLDQLALGLETD